MEFRINPTIKCMILGEPEKLTIAQKEIQEKYFDKYVVNISKPIFMEFTCKGINKGESLKKLCEIFIKLTVTIIAYLARRFNHFSP